MVEATIERLLSVEQVFLRVLQCKDVEVSGWWRYESLKNPFWRLYTNRGPEAAITTPDGVRWGLREGRILMVPPNVAFLTVPPDSPCRHLFIHAELIGPAAKPINQLFRKPMWVPDDRLLTQQADRLRADLATGGAPDIALQAASLCYGALAGLVRGLPRPSGKEWHQALTGWNPIAPALELIEEHPEGDLSVNRLAALCDLKRDRFLQVFKEHQGEPPAAWVRRRRLARASELLEFSDLGIEEIATQTGFFDRFHLTRHFTKMFGSGPAAWRKTTAAAKLV
jgi:AraC family transcriptional regulator of arabinose operon